MTAQGGRGAATGRRGLDGLLVVDKPVGPTSHDVVARVRAATGEPRVGHTGTLDPGASGVLPLVIGRATRLARFLSGETKSYDALVRLGVATDTYDADGQPEGPPHPGPLPAADAIAQALEAFRGTFEQRPPAFSAKRIAGRRSYRISRGGGAPTAPRPVPVTVHRLELLGVEGDAVRLRVDCTAGFYVRSLAHDLGRRLGVGAHLAALRRTRSGDLTLADAVPLEAIERDPGAGAAALVPLARMLPSIAPLRLTPDGARRARDGRDLGPADFAAPPPAPLGAPRFRLLSAEGELVGLAEPGGAPGLLHPSVVLV